jgi:hypothetical protein
MLSCHIKDKSLEEEVRDIKREFLFVGKGGY